MCYPVCGIVHIKEPLLLIDKSSLCGGSRFPFSLSEWSHNALNRHFCYLEMTASARTLKVIKGNIIINYYSFQDSDETQRKIPVAKVPTPAPKPKPKKGIVKF